MKTKIGIIGGGNMGSAIIAGIYKKYKVIVCELDTKRAGQLRKKYSVQIRNLKEVVTSSDAVILAIKPQNFEAILQEIRPLLIKKRLVISIAAGITCHFIEKRLGPNVRVVRVMPNLPVKAGFGITGICPGKHSINRDLILTCRLFACVGKTVVVKERHMDAVTAISGSGPAYVFYFVECLMNAAKKLNLDEKIAKDLIAQTMEGSLALLQESNEDAAKLRARVTSKGGTTQAALSVLKQKKFKRIIEQAVAAAAKRAKELSK